MVKTTTATAPVKFSFSSSVAGASFECSLAHQVTPKAKGKGKGKGGKPRFVGGRFHHCSSPKTYRLRPGRYRFQVRAVNGAARDSSPADLRLLGRARRQEMRIGAEASAVVGGTPLVLLDRIGAGVGGEVCAKLEYFNPGGSVKDRIGVAMIDAAEEEGLIRPGRSVVVEPTSGNTGIALAMVCAARGYELILTLPEGMSRERAKLLRAYGAEVRETPSLGGMNEAVALAEEIREQRKAFMPMQFSNPANAEAHRRTTAEEIWADTDGQVGAFVAGVGTGGTITGVGRMLQRTGPGGACRRGRAGELAGPLRRPARPAQNPGDRRRLRPRAARPLGRRRDPLGRRRGRAGDGAPAGQRRRGSWPGSRPGPTSGRRSRWQRGRRWPASASSPSSATRASATCPYPSSHHEPLEPSVSRWRRVVREVRADVAAARDRDPAATRRLQLRDPQQLGRGAGAPRPPRRPRADGSAGAAGAAWDRLRDPGA